MAGLRRCHRGLYTRASGEELTTPENDQDTDSGGRLSSGAHRRTMWQEHRPASAGDRLQSVDEIRRALRVAGRGEDRAVVRLEDGEPVGNVSGVILTRLQRQVKISAEKSGSKFGHEFFDGVAL